MKGLKVVLVALLCVSASFAEKDGFNADGSCDGQILFFNGEEYQCQSAYRIKGVSVNNCCNGNQWSQFTGHCNAEKVAGRATKNADEYAGKSEQKLCVTVGERCVQSSCVVEWKDFFGNKHCWGPYCKSTYRGSCCFNSKIARIINQQGRAQIKRGWGTAANPDCRGFTPDEFQKLDFSKIDLSEYINDVQSKIKIDGVNTGDVEQKVKDKFIQYEQKKNK